MADTNVKDFLGHPCQTTEAFERYDELIEEARCDTARDVRLVARRIGIDVMKVQDRLTHLCSLIDAMAKHTPDDTDGDELRALIEVASEYALSTSNKYERFAGVTLLALEKGGLWNTVKEVQA